MATSSSLAGRTEYRSESAKRLICPICFDTFKTPRSLPCLHIFCERCILSLISSANGETWKPDRFNCPLCRSAITAPVDIQNPFKWVKSFPLYHTVQTCLKNNEDIQTNLCDPCLCKEVHLISDVFCLNCAEYLCKDCAKCHLMFKAFKAHKLIKTNEIQKNPYRFFQDLNYFFCLRHSDSKIEYFCKGHDVLCCTKCAALDHRKCDDVVDIMEVCTGINETNETKRLQSKLDEFHQKLDKIKELADIRDKTVKKHSDGIIEQSLEVAIQCSTELFETFETHGTEQQIFIMVRKLHDQIEDYERTVEEQLSKVKRTPDLGVEVTSASILLERNDLVEKLQHSNLEMNINKEEEERYALSTKDNFHGKLLSEFNNAETVAVCLPHDINKPKPNYTGATFVSGNRIVVVDNIGKRSCLFNSNLIQITEKTFPSPPFAVTSLDGHTVAVSFPEKKTLVRILSVHSSFEHLKIIRTRWVCWGLSAWSETEIVVLCDINRGRISNSSNYSTTLECGVSANVHKAVILVIDTNGREKFIVDSIDSRCLGPGKQGTIQYGSKNIAVDKTRSRIICYVNILKKQGNDYILAEHSLVSTLYKDNMVGFMIADNTECGCIGLDKDGNIYCRNNYNGIYRLLPSGDRIRDLYLKPSSKNTAISFSPEDPNMFVLTTGNEPLIQVGRLC
ncbi:hypothetical protein CHS0354_006179 [Potamilus streckersoni]|uniref:Uncharacterized protein n=1 Tax=Potamilus streckersoni TaxID=2493646 RepID=A0AAE0WCK1_9BIVA|nr:hypothetical protein CHS0354_006179 [Potamilus streckersoni]